MFIKGECKKSKNPLTIPYMFTPFFFFLSFFVSYLLL